MISIRCSKDLEPDRKNQTIVEDVQEKTAHTVDKTTMKLCLHRGAEDSPRTKILIKGKKGCKRLYDDQDDVHAGQPACLATKAQKSSHLSSTLFRRNSSIIQEMSRFAGSQAA